MSLVAPDLNAIGLQSLWAAYRFNPGWWLRSGMARASFFAERSKAGGPEGPPALAGHRVVQLLEGRGHGALNSTESTIGAAASTARSKLDSGAMIAITRIRIDRSSGTSTR